ncbi:hypothetical protein D3C76_199460 [compost metagenome]
MRRHAATGAEHSCEVIFRQAAQAGQLPQAERFGQVRFDIVEHLPALMRGQATLELEPLAYAHLAEQGMAEHFMGQAAGQQAFAGLVPVHCDQLAKAPRLRRVVEKGAFAQLQFAGFAVKQADATQGELFLAEIQVGQADLAIDDPGRIVSGRQHAEFVGRAFAARLLAAERLGATGDVARQGMVAGPLVVAGIVVVVP